MKHQPIFVVMFVLFVLLFSACGRSTNSAGTTPVQVNMTDFKIASSVTSFIPGISYHFAITNNGHTAHEFMILPKSLGVMGGMQMGDMDKMALTKVENIAPGQTTTLDYTFGSSTAGSHPEFACYYPGHYEAGMKQEVVVNS